MAFSVLKSRKDNISVSQNNISGVESQPKIESDLAVESLRSRSYPGSQIVIENKLNQKGSYQRYIASYQSDGLKIYGLLTIPTGQKPAGGWPAIVFNHGYITPETYDSTKKYAAYIDYFAKNGYIVFMPDYRGNGRSEGAPGSAYFSPNYMIDDLNVIASIKKYPDVNPEKIGVWGHSMGGNIILRDLVVNTTDIKAAVIWGGVVGSYDDIINNWQRRVSYHPNQEDLRLRNSNRQNLINQYGNPNQNNSFWDTIDPTKFTSDITAPVQLHTGSSDAEVPPDFSQKLYDNLVSHGKAAEYYSYPGADHNISAPAFNLAMKRSLAFFDRYLK